MSDIYVICNLYLRDLRYYPGIFLHVLWTLFNSILCSGDKRSNFFIAQSFNMSIQRRIQPTSMPLFYRLTLLHCIIIRPHCRSIDITSFGRRWCISLTTKTHCGLENFARVKEFLLWRIPFYFVYSKVCTDFSIIIGREDRDQNLSILTSCMVPSHACFENNKTDLLGTKLRNSMSYWSLLKITSEKKIRFNAYYKHDMHGRYLNVWSTQWVVNRRFTGIR